MCVIAVSNMKPFRGYEALRRNRINVVDADYFVTICTRGHVSGLQAGELPKAIARELDSMLADKVAELRAWVLMPDHLHLFVVATGRLTLGQIVGRLKAKTRSALLERGLCWQGNYFEHRLRPDDPVEDVLRYIYLNPHRGLVMPGGTYAHFWLCPADTEWFNPTLNDNRPFPEWLV